MGEARTGVPRTYFFSFLVCIAAYIHTYIGEHVFIFLLCIYHSVVWVDWRELFLDQEIRVEFFFCDHRGGRGAWILPFEAP